MDSLTAHREWAHRPPDERYTSVQDLLQAATRRRLTTQEVVADLSGCEAMAGTDNTLSLRRHSRAGDHDAESAEDQWPLTHWSFGQLAAIAGAPPAYLRTLPSWLASEALNYGLERTRRRTAGKYQMLMDVASPRTLHAITSERFERVHHDELVSRIAGLMEDHPQWRLPLGYKDGAFGTEKVPSGAYLGDRDLFLFLVDGNREIDDPTDRTQSGLFRGFILRNSDVGAAALTLELFLFRVVCGNHIIHGLRRVASFRRRHVGALIYSEWSQSLAGVQQALDADTTLERSALARAASTELGANRDEVIDLVVKRFDLPRKQATEAFTLAEQSEPNPRSVWGYVQGLTTLSQQTSWQDNRFALDRTAGRLLSVLN